MRTEMTLTYKRCEVCEANPTYTIFYFESKDGTVYSWATSGSPKSIMDLPMDGEEVTISARINGTSLTYLKVVR